MAQDEESELVRLSLWELRLVKNYRAVNAIRQDTLLYFSDELVKLESQDLSVGSNVVRLAARK
jgi:hypothetical protein